MEMSEISSKFKNAACEFQNFLSRMSGSGTLVSLDGRESADAAIASPVTTANITDHTQQLKSESCCSSTHSSTDTHSTHDMQFQHSLSNGQITSTYLSTSSPPELGVESCSPHTQEKTIAWPGLTGVAVDHFRELIASRLDTYQRCGGRCTFDTNCEKALQEHNAYDLVTCMVVYLHKNDDDKLLVNRLRLWDANAKFCPLSHNSKTEHNRHKHTKISMFLLAVGDLREVDSVDAMAKHLVETAYEVTKDALAQEALAEKIRFVRDADSVAREQALADSSVVEKIAAVTGNSVSDIRVERKNQTTSVVEMAREGLMSAKERLKKVFTSKVPIKHRMAFVTSGEIAPEHAEANARYEAAQEEELKRLEIANLGVRVVANLFTPGPFIKYFLFRWIMSLMIGVPSELIRDAVLQLQICTGIVNFLHKAFTIAEFALLSIGILKFISGFQENCFYAVFQLTRFICGIPKALKPLTNRIAHLVFHSVSVRFDAYAFVTDALSKNATSLATSPVHVPDDVSWVEWMFIRMVSLVTSACLCVDGAIAQAQPVTRLHKQYDRFKEVVLYPSMCAVALAVLWLNYIFLGLTLWNCLFFSLMCNVTLCAFAAYVYWYVRSCEKYSHSHELNKVTRLQSQVKAVADAGKLFLNHTAAAVSIASQPDTFRKQNEKYNREQRISSAIGFSASFLTVIGSYYATTNMEKMLLLGVGFCTRMLQVSKPPKLSELGYIVPQAGEEDEDADSQSDEDVGYTVIDGESVYDVDSDGEEKLFSFIWRLLKDPVATVKTMTWTARTTIVAVLCVLIGAGLSATVYALSRKRRQETPDVSHDAAVTKAITEVIDKVKTACEPAVKPEGLSISRPAPATTDATPIEVANVDPLPVSVPIAPVQAKPKVEAKGKQSGKKKRKGYINYDDADTARQLLADAKITGDELNDKQLDDAVTDLFNAFVRRAENHQNWNDDPHIDALLHGSQVRTRGGKIRMIRAFNRAGLAFEAALPYFKEYQKHGDKQRALLTPKREKRTAHFEAILTKKKKEAASVNSNVDGFIDKFRGAIGKVRHNEDVVCNFVLVSNGSGVSGITVLHAFEGRDHLTFSIIGSDKKEHSAVVSKEKLTYGSQAEEADRDIAIVDLTSVFKNLGVALPAKHFKNIQRNTTLLAGSSVSCLFIGMAKGANVTPCRAQLKTDQKYPYIVHDASTSVGDCGGILVTSDKFVTSNFPVVIGLHAWGNRAAGANGAYTFDAEFVGNLN